MKKFLILLLVSLLSAPAFAGDTPAVGTDAPAFKLQDQNGDWHALGDYSGQWLAVYFYPRDDTPGCTKEACNFRDNIYAFKAIGAAVEIGDGLATGTLKPLPLGEARDSPCPHGLSPALEVVVGHGTTVASRVWASMACPGFT